MDKTVSNKNRSKDENTNSNSNSNSNSNPNTKIAIVSDLHVGSVYGLLPPLFVNSAGAEVKQNTGQKHLWECWKHFSCSIGDVDVLVVNGDVVDGGQRRQVGSELCLPIIEDQAAAALFCLKFLHDRIGKPKVFFVAGTEYHDQVAAREVEVVAERLNGERYAGLGTGRYCHEVLDLNVGGVIVNLSHSISIAGGLYRATPPDREAVWSALAGKEGKAIKADIIVRSHAHHYVHVEHASKHAVITPCWQLQTRFMRRYSVYRTLPDIGGIVIKVSPYKKKQRRDPCHIEKYLYPLPESPSVRL